MDTLPDLHTIFENVNAHHFEGKLVLPSLRWNSRLRTSAGRFIPGSRNRFFQIYQTPVIEVATYLREEADAMALIMDTVAHEMIHYWLWLRRRPYGHSNEFLKKMKQMGVSRYNPVPKRRPFKHVYACNHCQESFPVRRRLGSLACAACCKKYAEGRYDKRFKLILVKSLY